MDLDIASPDADEAFAVRVVGYPGGGHLATIPGALPGELRALKAAFPGFFVCSW